MYYIFRKVLVLYVRIAVYGRNTAVPYRIKHLRPQNTVRNVRSVTVYGPPTIRPLPYTVRCGALASLRSPTYSAQATRLRHAINHSTCSTPSPFRCSDYMTTPIIYCYIFRPPGKWFWTILHATSSLPARWTPLVERKPDSKESGIYVFFK